MVINYKPPQLPGARHRCLAVIFALRSFLCMAARLCRLTAQMAWAPVSALCDNCYLSTGIALSPWHCTAALILTATILRQFLPDYIWAVILRVCSLCLLTWLAGAFLSMSVGLVYSRTCRNSREDTGVMLMIILSYGPLLICWYSFWVCSVCLVAWGAVAVIGGYVYQ